MEMPEILVNISNFNFKMKYYFYINKETGLIKMYDRVGTNKIDPEKFEVKSLNLTKAEEKSLDTFGHKKIIGGKLVAEESIEVKKKKELKEKINKVATLSELKQILLEQYE